MFPQLSSWTICPKQGEDRVHSRKSSDQLQSNCQGDERKRKWTHLCCHGEHHHTNRSSTVRHRSITIELPKARRKRRPTPLIKIKCTRASKGVNFGYCMWHPLHLVHDLSQKGLCGRSFLGKGPIVVISPHLIQTNTEQNSPCILRLKV